MRLFRPMGGHRDDQGDAALLRAVAAGDSAAMAALYDRHAGWLYARLTRRCADPEVVREVLQDTFVTVWRSAASHRGEEAGGWLWVIAARRLVDSLRMQERRTRLEESGSMGQDPTAAAWVQPSAQAVPSAEEHVLAGLEYGDMGTALDRLSPELRQVLQATVVDGLTTRETARLLRIPEGTVKTRAMRARRELRAALAALGAADALEPMGGAV